jgi:small subunit ribosomal protein S20
MPQRRAAKKALRQNKKRREKNLVLQREIRLCIKKFKKAVEAKDTNTAKDALRVLYGVLDKTAAKRIIHPKKAARKKSSFAKLLNKISSK